MKSLRSLLKDLAKLTGKKRKPHFGKEEDPLKLISCKNIFGIKYELKNATLGLSSATMDDLENLKECFLKNTVNFEKRIERINSKNSNLNKEQTSSTKFGGIISLTKASSCNKLYDNTKKELIDKIKDIDSKISKLEGKEPTMGDDIYEKIKANELIELKNKIPSVLPDSKCASNTQLLKWRSITILEQFDNRLSELEKK